MEADLARHLLTLLDLFVGTRGGEESTVAKRAANDWRFFSRLREGTTTFTVRKYDGIVGWFSDNWPEELAWPADVPRPAPAEPEPQP